MWLCYWWRIYSGVLEVRSQSPIAKRQNFGLSMNATRLLNLNPSNIRTYLYWSPDISTKLTAVICTSETLIKHEISQLSRHCADGTSCKYVLCAWAMMYRVIVVQSCERLNMPAQTDMIVGTVQATLSSTSASRRSCIKTRSAAATDKRLDAGPYNRNTDDCPAHDEQFNRDWKHTRDVASLESTPRAQVYSTSTRMFLQQYSRH